MDKNAGGFIIPFSPSKPIIMKNYGKTKISQRLVHFAPNKFSYVFKQKIKTKYNSFERKRNVILAFLKCSEKNAEGHSTHRFLPRKIKNAKKIEEKILFILLLQLRTNGFILHKNESIFQYY